MGKRPSLFNPQVEQYLLADEGEFVVDEITKHAICMIGPMALTVVGAVVMVLSTLVPAWWVPIALVGLVASCIGLWHFHQLRMDRFVVTNMRVFRVNGVLTRHIATMPLTRILDISVFQSPFGMMFNYGHFVFESAAVDQGLHKITYVPDPARRDLTIQRVIQRAGLRAAAHSRTPGTGDGTG